MTPVSPGSGAWLARLVVGAVLMLAGILAVVYLAARFVVWPNVDALAARYAGSMEARLGAPVTWKAIRTDWTGLRPSIEIDGATIGSGDRAIRAERLFATISLRALLRGEADFHELRLDRPVVPVVRRGDKLMLAALPAPRERPDSGSGLLPWLLQQSDVRIGGGTVVIRDEDQPRRSLQLRDISLVLKSRGVEHDARLDVGSGDNLAATLVVQAALTRDAAGDPADWRSWSGSLQWEARQLLLRPLVDQLPADLAESLRAALPAVVVDSVRGSVDPWMSVQLDRGTLGDLRVRLRSDDVALMLADPAVSGAAASAGGLRFTRIGTDVRIRRTPAGGLELSTYGFELEEAGGAAIRAAAPPLALVLAPDHSLERFSGGFDTIEAGPVLDLARMVAAARATGEMPGAIERIGGGGQVSGLKLSWQRPSGDGTATWNAEGSFAQASLEVAPDEQQRKFPFKIRVPGMRGLSGTFQASQSGGRATLRTPPAPGAAASAPAGPPPGGIDATAAAASTVTFGGVLVEPEVPFTSLDSRFAWKVDRGAGPGWLTLSVERFAFANADGRGAITGSYRSGGRGAGIVDFRARIDSLQAKQLWRYMPHEVPEGVRHWLREALEAGTLEGVDAVWRGDIRDFPYRPKSQDGPGQFNLAGKARDLLFKYAEDWPAIHGIAGDFVFDHASMRLQAQRATAMEVALTGVEARIDDLAQGILSIQGQAEGDAGHMLRFVNASPLASALGDATRPMNARGPAKLALELRLPLKNLDAFSARGDLDLAGATLDYEPVGAPLEAITGRLQFTGKTLAFNGVRARLMNAPMTLSGGTRDGGRMQITSEGRMTAESLRLLSGEPLSRHLNGSTAYKAEIDVGPGGARVSVASDLVGLGSDLPAPVGKAPDARMPLALSIVPIESPRRGNGGAAAVAAERIEASIGDEVHLVAERERTDARRPMQLARAALAVNRQPALPDAGVALQFTGQRIDLDAWMDAVAEPDAAAAPAGGTAGATAGGRASSSSASGGGNAGSAVRDAPPTMPITVSLLADEVRVAGRNLSKVVLGASRHETQWLANLSAQQVNGFLTWNSRFSGRLTARLGRLEIPRSEQQEIAATLSTGPTTLPAMDIEAKQFVLGGLDLGQLQLVARNSLVRPAGEAQPAPRGQRRRVWRLETLRLTNPAAELDATGVWDRATDLQYTLKIHDAGAFLDRLQLKGVVRGGSGELAGDLRWSGTPFSMDLPTLAGHVDIKVRSGQFLKVEPGAAKLIGVLNLQALPKILSLDFRDIFARGFAFDELAGMVDIEQGVARTDSLAMRGLQAVVQIKGEADLRASTQDLRVLVIPELSGGLATLAYAAIVNPAVGLGAFLAQSIFSQPLSRALAHEFEITGSWANPTVIQRRREPLATPKGE